MLGAKGCRAYVNSIALVNETLCSVRVSAFYLAFVTVVLNVKLQLGMFQTGKAVAIDISDVTQGAAFNFVLARFIYPCCVKHGVMGGVFTESMTTNQ